MNSSVYHLLEPPMKTLTPGEPNPVLDRKNAVNPHANDLGETEVWILGSSVKRARIELQSTVHQL